MGEHQQNVFILFREVDGGALAAPSPNDPVLPDVFITQAPQVTPPRSDTHPDQLCNQGQAT